MWRYGLVGGVGSEGSFIREDALPVCSGVDTFAKVRGAFKPVLEVRGDFVVYFGGFRDDATWSLKGILLEPACFRAKD